MPSLQLPKNIVSLWMATTPATDFAKLMQNIETDVAVIGGGIAGINAAYFLMQRGLSVALIEAGRIASATSGNTTAKITSLHELKYTYLKKEFGLQKAQIYADSNQWAVKEVRNIIERENIECDFYKNAAYTFAKAKEDVKRIEQEVEVALELNLPASFVKLPEPKALNMLGAIRFDDQAYFHPRKYLIALAKIIDGKNCHIFENTRVVGVTEKVDFCEVRTDKYTLKAKFVIEATNYPSFMSSGPLSKLNMTRSVAIASKISTDYPDGMFIGTNKDDPSFRSHQATKEKWLLTGSKHRGANEGVNLNESFEQLAHLADDIFKIKSVQYKWGAADTMSPDKIPLIGRIPQTKRLFITTGYSAWGMTTSLLSAKLLSDLITNTQNDWEDLYNPNRLRR